MAFSNIDSTCYNNINEDLFDNNIIILKKVKSLKQLRITEKELVRLNYKEAIIKGFTLKGIQQYIATKTKIWIEWSCLEYLKKAEEQENKEWYYRLARDQFAYIGVYREAIDELIQIRNELWLMIMDKSIDASVRTNCLKEIHNLVKSKTLLLRDLPFIMNLSKYFDLSKLNNSLPTKTFSTHNKKNNYTDKISNSLDRRNINELKSSDNKFDCSINKDKKLDDDIIDNECISGDYRNLDDEIMEDMQAQTHITDSLNGKSIEEITEEDWDKIITPEHKESVRKLQELLDD